MPFYKFGNTSDVMKPKAVTGNIGDKKVYFDVDALHGVKDRFDFPMEKSLRKKLKRYR